LFFDFESDLKLLDRRLFSSSDDDEDEEEQDEEEQEEEEEEEDEEEEDEEDEDTALDLDVFLEFVIEVFLDLRLMPFLRTGLVIGLEDSREFFFNFFLRFSSDESSMLKSG
jgi:hypothetical protein